MNMRGQDERRFKVNVDWQIKSQEDRLGRNSD